MTRIYIAGPISSAMDTYVYNFAFAEDYIRSNYPKCEIVNPVKITDHLDPNVNTWEDYMEVCIPKLIRCNTLYLINGWAKSKGAKLEYLIARELYFQVIFQDNDLF